MYSLERCAAAVTAIEVAEDGVWVTDRYGGLRYQNAALQGLLSTEPDRPALEQAMADARRAALARADERRRRAEVTSDAGAESVTALARPGPVCASLTLPLRTPTLEYRVRGTAVEGGLNESGEVMVVVWIRRCRPRILTPQALRERYGLTPREVRVAALMAARSGSREIAEALDISPHTARRHAEAVLRKLGVHSRSDVREKLRD